MDTCLPLAAVSADEWGAARSRLVDLVMQQAIV